MKVIYTGQDITKVTVEDVAYDAQADGSFDIPDDVAERLLHTAGWQHPDPDS